MLFNSFPFVFVFLPVAVAGFYLAAKVNQTCARLWLIWSSFAFYTWWHPPFTIILLLSVCFNYGCGMLISSLQNKPLQRYVVPAAIGANLLALFYYKYVFALSLWLMHMGLAPRPVAQGVLLPLGISFFTFTQIGFLLDSRDGKVTDRRFFNYVLFVTFFPHLIAGPILHHKEIMPQFGDKNTYKFQHDNFARGFALFVVGMLKKVVIADSLSGIVSSGFANPSQLPMTASWAAILCYSVQLYFDFSGYSDMAIGIARMFNIWFPLNFDSPYKTTSIIEYWQHWHMTLTRYLNLYIYNPLALSATRKIASRGIRISRKELAQPVPFTKTVIIPLFITMTLAGIWHGAGLQFLIFGLLHASYLSINRVWRTYGPTRDPKLPLPIGLTLAYRAITYLSVLLALVFFRSSSTSTALALISGMIGLHGFWAAFPVPGWLLDRLGHFGSFGLRHSLFIIGNSLGDPNVAIRGVIEMIIGYWIIWFMPNSQTIIGIVGVEERMKQKPATEIVSTKIRFRPNIRWGLTFGLLTAIAILEIGAKSEFLYFQF